MIKKDFVPFVIYNKKQSHKTHGTPGRYPVKAAKMIRKVLENAKGNAEFKGLDEKKLRIVHANAYKTLTLGRTKPKGRAKPSRINLSNVEIVVRELG